MGITKRSPNFAQIEGAITELAAFGLGLGREIGPKPSSWVVISTAPFRVEPSNSASRGLENVKVMGFRTLGGKVLGLDVYPGNLERVRLWIEPPSPPSISGIDFLRPKKCADLCRRELFALAEGKGVYLEATTNAAFEALLAWYS